MEDLIEVLDTYMEKTTNLKEFCKRCLETKRWSGNVVVMVVDAAFDSIGLNYFNSIVPKVIEFEEKFVNTGKIKNLNDLAGLQHDKVKNIWANERSWRVARSISSYLNRLRGKKELNDRETLRDWAASSGLKNWKENPIGSIKGVGLVTYQYLRMMGGIDTSMPDKIVRRIIDEILEKAKVEMPTKGGIELIETINRIGFVSNYRPIEICWMTWLIQSEGDQIRMEKYRDLFGRI